MNSGYREYQEEKRKLKTRFVIVYIGSVVLLLLAFGALWYFNSPSDEPVYTDMPGEQSESAALLNEDQVLHDALMKLDKLDINYSKLLTESADSGSLDSLNNLINISETDFSNLVDRMYKQKSFFKNPSNAERSDSIIRAFISALNYRKSNNSLRMAFFGNDKHPDGDTLAILRLQIDVENKRDTIRNLLEQLKYQNQFNANTFSAQQNSQPGPEIKSMQSDLIIQKDSIENLLSLYSSVVKANKSLTSQLNKLQSNTNNTEAVIVPEKINSLNARIDDLNAELALAQIDCNLTRANAKDIIYNSRQRKDLLQESLNSLKNLSGSGNPVIQRKVKDKMQLLQSIASTVRD